MYPQTLLADLTPVISAKAIEKSGRVLKAIALLYFPFHGLKPSELFEFYGPLAFVSSAIYQSDELNERNNAATISSLKAVKEYLAHQGFLDEWTKRYLQDGENYLSYERHFRTIPPRNLEEIFTVTRWRSFDFRILHCLLHRFIGKPYTPLVFGAYEAFEMLMEINDDIGSYEDDLSAGTFNFLCALSLLSPADIKETAEAFRRNVTRQIGESRKLLPTAESEKFAEILNVYSSIVPEPVIPNMDRLQCSE